LKLSDNKKNLSLFVPAFSNNWTSWSNGTSVTLEERDPNSEERSLLATLSIEYNQDFADFRVFLDIPNGKYRKGSWKILKWCALEIQDGPHKRRYVLHEQSLEPENRQLQKNLLKWVLPLVVKSGTKPFDVEHVKLAVSGQTFTFRAGQSAGKDLKVSLVDPEVTNHFTAHFDASESRKGKLHRLNLALEYKLNDGRLAGQFSIYIKKHPSTWKDAERRFKEHADKKLKSQLGNLPPVVTQTVDGIRNWYMFLTKNKNLDETPLFGQIKSLMDLKGNRKISDNVVTRLDQLKSTIQALQSDAVKMKDISESIISAKIVSARIFYKVHRPPKVPTTTGSLPGDETDNVIEIDVIGFDSSQPQGK